VVKAGEETVDVKRLDRSQIQQIRELWQGLNAHHHSVSTNFKEHFASFAFERRIGQLDLCDELAVFLAMDGDIKAGYCLASVEKGAGEIDSIFLYPEYRKRGIGERLMGEALDWLEAHGCSQIRVAIACGNEDAIGFYRKFGFAERFLVMQRMTR
jgi:ribosomal protein S18 acetylase RimI-like enzyme